MTIKKLKEMIADLPDNMINLSDQTLSTLFFTANLTTFGNSL